MTEQKLLEEPILLSQALFGYPQKRSVSLGSGVLPEMCQEDLRRE